MPVNKIAPSNRAKGAIAAIVAVSIGGMVALFPREAPVHDDVALAVKTLVLPWEGMSLHAYLDTLAKPPRWTICGGDTNDVKPGMIETPDGCNKRLAVKMERDYRAKLVKCMPGFASMPISVRAMFNSLDWNIGNAATCASTAAALAIAGKYREACEAATKFNRAGSQVRIGLVNRREMGDAQRIGEAELCVSGL